MRLAAPSFVLLLSACGGGAPRDDGGAPVDGGTDGGPAAPQIPWLLPDGGVALEVAAPMLTPCADGFREMAAAGGPSTCEPYPEGGAESCPPGQAHFVGEAGCAPVGAACPSGDFAEGLADDGSVIFVRPGATGGDGTRALPFGTIGEGLALARAGTTVALARGRYEEVLSLRAGVTLAGACAEATVIAWPGGPEPRPAVINVATGSVTLRDLSVGMSDRIAIEVIGQGGDARLEGVVVEGAPTVGVLASEGAHLTASGLVVRDIRLDAKGYGRGIDVDLGATAELTRIVVERAGATGIYGYGAGTSLTVTDVVVRDTGNPGLHLLEAASATVRRALFEACGEIGIAVDSGGTVVVEDAVIRDTRSRPSDGLAGRGLNAQNGATATVSRVLFDRNRDVAIFGDSDGTSLHLTDVVVRDTQSLRAGNRFGRGLTLQTGATATVDRALFERNRDVGVYLGDRTTAVLTDVAILDTEGRESDGTSGRGLSIQYGATVEATRLRIERSREIGVFIADEGTSLGLTDAVIRDTRSRAADGAGGRGLNLQPGADVTLDRVLVERNRDIGVFADGAGSRLTLTDVVIRDTDLMESDGTYGRGLNVQFGVVATGTRLVVERSRDIGITTHGAGTTATFADVVVRDTDPDGLGRDGTGAGSFAEAGLELRRFLVTGSALVGVQLTRGATADLHEGEVSHNLIGVNVQTPGFDLGRLMDRVIYRDNVRDLASDELAVPDAALPFE